MRLFVAIDVPASLKQKINDLKKEISFKGVKPSNTEQTHLTLAFYDDADPEDVISSLKNIKFKPFYINISGYGFFPNEEKPRISFLNVEKNPHLNDLKQAIKRGDYTPHITLARLKNPPLHDLKKVLSQNYFNQKFKVESIKLYRSEKTPLGHVHNVLHIIEADMDTKKDL